jgi:hypothetical protein
VFAAGVAGIGAVRQVRVRTMPADLDLWVWVAVGVAAWAAGLRFFGHYWLQTVPPLVLLATPVVSRWRGRAERLAITGVVLPALAAWSLLFVPGSFHHRPDPARLARYLREHTTPDQRVLVWGSYPEVILAADRLPAGGLVHSDFVVGRSGGREDPTDTVKDALPEAKRIMLASLRSAPPELVVDTSTATDLGYRNYPLTLVPELDSFVHDGYEQVAVVDGVTVFKRRIVPG